MDKSWLVRLFEEAGLPGDQAERAAEATRVRLLRRERARTTPLRGRRALTEFLVRDPLVSLNRIVGRGDAGLPFFDDETKQLSLVAFANVLGEIGLDPVVAMAYAKVVVEAWEPKDLYTPVWQALGKTGPLDLDELRRTDWSPLRVDVPPPGGRDTVVVRSESASATVVTPTAPTTPTTTPPRTGTSAAPGSASPRRGPPPRPRTTGPSAVGAAPPKPGRPR